MKPFGFIGSEEVVPLIGIATNRQVPLYLTGVLDDSPTKASAEITIIDYCYVWFFIQIGKAITDSSLPRLLNFVSSACTEEQVLAREGRSLSTGQENKSEPSIYYGRRPNRRNFMRIFRNFYDPVEGINPRPATGYKPLWCHFFIFLSRFCCG